ncbi:GL11880 [Drosophila persimilis]|uniref:GL11880 n=1 Tax=Drosophila persimilis TaxID=7234 RepID=B4HBV8_DROPE|nr:GL11880 [Drosophila persimilis]
MPKAESLPSKGLALGWILCMACATLFSTGLAQVDDIDNAVNSTISDTEPIQEHPSEVQKAVCTVTAGEIKASAEAVTTKTLKGVCGSDEMNLAFKNLETKLYAELREIKWLLEQVAMANSAMETKASTKKMPILKELATNHNALQGVRDEEVNKFNNTMLADQDFKLFTYYWKLENFTNRIEDLSTSSVNSKSLQLRCTFHHLNRELLNLQLGYAHVLPGDQKNIVLDMGGIFKTMKHWTDDTPFKHKISILDQNYSHRKAKDLGSQELTKLETGFSIPHSALLGSTYIKQNSLLIQIILYL